MGIITNALRKMNLNPQLNPIHTSVGENWQDIVPLMYTAMGYFGYQPPQTFYQLVNSLSSWEFITDDKIARSIASLPLKLKAMQKKSSRKFLSYGEAKYLKNAMGKLSPVQKYGYLKEQGVDVVEITDHRFNDMMLKPNHTDVRFTFMYSTAMRIELAGTCGWYKVLDKFGLPIELWTLPLTWTGELKPIPDQKLIIGGYLYIDGNIRETFKLDEVVFFKLPHLKGPWEGMSAIKSQMYPYSIDDQQQKQTYNVFKNNSMFGNVFSTEQSLTSRQVTELKELMQDTYQGAKNAGKPLFLHSGLSQDKGLQTSFRDLMLNEINKNVRDKMLSAHALSPTNLGMIDSANRANMEASQESFYVDCIKPRVMLIEEYIEQCLLPMFDDGFTCDFELPVFEDAAEKRSQLTDNIKNMVITPQEARISQGMVEDPELEGLRFMPNTVTAIRDGKVDPNFKPVPPLALEPFNNPEEPKKPNIPPPPPPPPKPKKQIKLFTAESWTKERKVSEWKAADERITEKIEPIIHKAIARHFKEQRKFVLSSVEAEFKIIHGIIYNMGSSVKRKWLSENKDKVNKGNINKAEWKAKLKKDLQPAIKKALSTAGEFYGDRLAKHGYADEEFTFSVTDPTVKQWIGDKLEETASEVTKTTYDQIAGTLKEGYEAGDTVAQMADRINHVFDVADQSRANNIARTESTAANNKADIETVRQADLEDLLQKFWIDQQDGAVRDTHKAAGDTYSSASPINIDDEFKVGDDSMDAPGDGSTAEENCNCRCVLGYVERK
jgi:HK97 family phage portal protein